MKTRESGAREIQPKRRPSLGDASEDFDASAPIDSLAFSPDGKTLALGCGDGTVRRFEVGTRRVLPELIHAAKRSGRDRGIPALAFSNDGRKLASGNREGTIVVWDLAE